MKPRTRDNLIYLTVGLVIAAVVTINFFYADSRGQKPWWPSRFAFRAVTTPALLAYFVIKEMLRTRATLFQMFTSVLFATLLQLGIMFGLRRVVDQLPGLSFSTLAAFELFLVWQLTISGALYFLGIGNGV